MIDYKLIQTQKAFTMFFLNDHAKLDNLMALLLKRTYDLELELWSELFAVILPHKNEPGFSDRENKLIAHYQADPSKHAIYQKREHFSRSALLSMVVDEDDPKARAINRYEQLTFYRDLKQQVQRIQKEIDKNNYTAAADMARNIFASESNVSSTDGKKESVSLKIGRSGCRGRGFILADPIFGLVGIVSSIVLLTASIILAPFFCCAGSKYFGTFSFDIDMVLCFLDSIRKLTFALIFPLGMLYAKCTTDSFNTTKGEVTRLFESVIACCERINANSPRLTDLTNDLPDNSNGERLA